MYRTLLGLAVVLSGMLAVAQERGCEEGELTSVEGTGCRQFRMCDGASRWSTPMDCAPGTLFDPEKKECDFISRVPCQQTQRTGGCRPGVTPGSGCRNFTLCVFNNAVTIPCGNNTVFSDFYGVCVWPWRLSIQDKTLC